jgi:CheY-like chemotaxis protein
MQQAVMQHRSHEKHSADSTRAHERASRRRRTIVLADDSILQRMMTRTMLEARGYHVLEAGNGREVLELVQTMHPDLVLMDVAMPSMDGISATRRIRAEGGALRDTPVVFLTALDERADRQSAISAGGDDYLVKPVSDRELLRVVERWADGRSRSSNTS